MYFDRFDICYAYYCYAYNWHSGQFSDVYRWLGRLENLKFRPSPLFSGAPSDLEPNAKAIYQGIVERMHGRWSTVSNPRPEVR
jgi:hypothetical protein